MLSPANVVVPKPVLDTDSTVVDAEFAISNALPVVLPQIVRFAYGAVVPMPTLPPLSM